MKWFTDWKEKKNPKGMVIFLISPAGIRVENIWGKKILVLPEGIRVWSLDMSGLEWFY